MVKKWHLLDEERARLAMFFRSYFKKMIKRIHLEIEDYLSFKLKSEIDFLKRGLVKVTFYKKNRSFFSFGGRLEVLIVYVKAPRLNFTAKVEAPCVSGETILKKFKKHKSLRIIVNQIKDNLVCFLKDYEKSKITG